jgi:hypothetical protein
LVGAARAQGSRQTRFSTDRPGPRASSIEIDYQVGEVAQGLAEDISVKGLRGVFPRPLPEDALVPLRIYLHDRGRIHRFDTNAEIIWKARSRKIRGGLSYGLAFLTMKDMDKAYLRTFISEHLKG